LIKEEAYIDFLLNYCKKNNINALLSLLDLDLFVLSKHKSEFDAINVDLLISSEKVIETCNDKWQTFLFLSSINIKTPLTFLNIEDVISSIDKNLIQFPIIIKPRFGTGSIGVYEANDFDDLYFYKKKIVQTIVKSYINLDFMAKEEKIVIYQEKIIGNEYNLDIINDLNSNYQTTIVKQKLEVRIGETFRALITKNKVLKELGYTIAQHLKHRLNCDCDLIVNAKNEAYIIDLNPRFGGGYPFSHISGVDLPRAILSWLKNENIDYEWKDEKDGTIIQKEITIRIVND
jgi:carbamoyl-phosphate synthase large subunit